MNTTINTNMLEKNCNHTILKTICKIVIASLLIALSAQFVVPIGLIPVTMQNFCVIALAYILGPNLAVAAVLAYIAEGAAGLPVFSAASSGMARLLGPSAGFIWGFVLLAYLAGHLSQLKYRLNFAYVFFTSSMILIVHYGSGLMVLSQYLGLNQAFNVGLKPFIVGDLLKIIFLAIALPMYKNTKTELLD